MRSGAIRRRRRKKKRTPRYLLQAITFILFNTFPLETTCLTEKSVRYYFAEEEVNLLLVR